MQRLIQLGEEARVGFDYDKIKSRADEGGTVWASYSDLFMMLSVVFLLLYVTASLRSGTFSVQKNLEYQRISRKAADLEEQIRVYNALRDEQLKHDNEEEQRVYQQLMSKLTLLQDEARDEKEELRRRAKDNEVKEFALNKYQQLIRNIINVNVLAKGHIKRRDQLIETKEQLITENRQVIATQDSEIQSLNREIEKRQTDIDTNKRRIAAINFALKRQVETLHREQKKARSSKQALEKAIAELHGRSANEIRSLERKNTMAIKDLGSARASLEDAQARLAQSMNAIEGIKSQSEQEKVKLISQLERTKAEYQEQIETLRKSSEIQLETERIAFQNNLRKQKLTAAARASKEAAFRAMAEKQALELDRNLRELDGKVSMAETQLRQARTNESRYLASINNLTKEKAEMAADLKRAKELAEARQKLAARIRDNFAKSAINADVDAKTGDVVLTFGDDYFETGRADLKPTMETRLRTFVPSYTKSLLGDLQAAKNISNVEIIGFASSTYKGKYVNPKSLRPKDREAVDYNLRLSFARANSIFKYIFDTKKLTYEHQQDLLPLVKVVGRGYLPEGKDAQSIPDGLSETEFCKRYGCQQAQRVIVRFNLKD